MRTLLLTLTGVIVLAIGCTNDAREQATDPSRTPSAKSPTDDQEQIEIYAEVIRHLVTEDHTFGHGSSPFKHVYVVNGAIRDAGDARGNHFGPAPQPFPSTVVNGIEQELRDLPPLEFVTAADKLREGRQGMGGVRNNGVIITLGPIEYEGGEVHVGNGLWCGGLCGQWLTYVLQEKEGHWRIAGTTGTTAIS